MAAKKRATMGAKKSVRGRQIMAPIVDRYPMSTELREKADRLLGKCDIAMQEMHRTMDVGAEGERAFESILAVLKVLHERISATETRGT
jgi:hypothetical protein